MFCPNYRIKTVFDGFNEVIEAFGGKAMTEEEFRSSELRNQRTGLDYSAMEAAYKLYHRNGGNFLDKAPNGKTSILFLTLLSEFDGDRALAIKAKSAVYSDNFRNWFGDWLSEDKTDVSKVVDLNGEPLVVYHHTNNENLSEFDEEFNNYFSLVKNGTKHAIFFTTTKEKILNRSYTISVFLNLKNPFIYTGTKESMHKNGTDYTTLVNEAESKEGAIFYGLDDNRLENQTVLVAYNPNQIKSATGNIEIEHPNTGFSLTDGNIYNLESRSTIFLNAENMMSSAALENVLDPQISAKLLDDEFVSSRDVIQSMLNNNSFDKSIESLAAILQKHNIPIKVDNSLGFGTLAETATGKDGKAVVILNADLLKNVSKKYAGIAILHELIHAVTVNAINNPQTKEQKAFAKANKKILSTLRKAFIGREYLLNNSEYGAYALTSEEEFAAVFITDEQVRNLMYDIAKAMDKDGGIILILKDFINAVSNLLINRSVFTSAEELLSEYHKQFEDFLNGQTAVNVNFAISQEEIKALCRMENSIFTSNEAIIDSVREIDEFLKTAKYNKLISIHKVKKNGAFENIADILQTRISALRTSQLPTSKKQTAINNTSKLLDMYVNDHTPRYAALRTTVSSVIPQLLEDLNKLRDLHADRLTITSSEYMYLLHSNFGAFQQVFNDIKTVLSKQAREIINEYNESSKQGSDITEQDLLEIAQDIDNISGAINSALLILKWLNEKITAEKIVEKAKQANSPDGVEYAAQLLADNYKFDDVSSIWTNLGAIDSSTNETLRILASMLNDANQTAHYATISVAEKLVTAAKALKKGEKLSDIYETYKGEKTGYVVREVNFGHFYAEYDKQMLKINEFISKKYDISLEPDNRRAPDSTGVQLEIKTRSGVKKLTATEAWNILRNEWLSDNCHRKYKKEYYEAWANVPQFVKDALDDINSQVQAILIAADAIDEKGYRHLEKLSEAQWKEYNKLQIERKYLYSDYDMFGNKKDVNDISYEIAKALQELNLKLYPEDNQERVKNVEAWKQARQAIIDDPTKTDDDLRDWDIRNSRLVFRQDEGHDVWKQIQDELDFAAPYYGNEHEEITKQIKDLLKPYRLQNGEIIAEEMTDAVKNLLKSLYKKRNEIEIDAAKKSAIIKSKRDARKSILEKYIEFEENDYIKSIKREYYKLFTDESGNFDEDSFYAAMMEFGFFTDPGDSFLDLYDTFQLNTWNKHAVAKDREKYMKYEPGDGWIERQNESKWINPEFKKYEHYGSTMIPLKEKYANKLWDKIKQQYNPITNLASGTLGEMYKLTLDTIKESNNLQTNRIHHDNYLLPQVMASSIRRMIRARSGFAKEILYIISEKIGFRYNQNDYIDSGVGDEIAFDAEGNPIKPKKHIGSYADGRSYNTIPQWYTKKLDDPSRISSDLVNMLISYYRMSKMYNEKSKIKDDCEAIVDNIQDRTYTKTGMLGVEDVRGELSNTFKAARQFLDMQMYGQYFKRYPAFGGKYEVTISLQLLKQYTTAVNLGMNAKVAAVGFFTSQWVHLINACVGLKYSKRHLVSAFFEVLYRVGKSILTTPFGKGYINNHKTNDKMMLLMEEFNAANQGERKGEHTNRNILVQGILGNLTFGMMSGFDFLSKSNIMVATLKAHHYVDGEFLTFDDLERFRAKLTEEEYAKKLTRWHNGKNLYSIFSGKNRELYVEPEYKEAWNKAKILITSRVLKYAEDADGMATQLQKALMTQSWIGAFFLIHRQYLGLMLQQRWGGRVYDYDTHQYKNAIFLTAFKYGAEVIKNSLFGSGIAGAIAGLAILGSGAGAITVGSTLALLSHTIYRYTHKGTKKKSIPEINKEFFGMDSFFKLMTATLIPFGFKPKYNNPLDEKTYLNQRLNFYDIKRILCEVLLYNAILAPFAGMIAALADDDDDDKFMLLMFAYWMRAFLWEAYTPYRPTEVLGAIKSATAAVSPLEKAENVVNSVLSVLSPRVTMNLIVPSIFGIPKFIWEDEEDDYYNEEISRGAYSYNEFADLFFNDERGWTRREQAFFKTLPVHNLYELIKDSKSKRRYIENQIMHIKQNNQTGNSFTDIFFNDKEQ